MDALTYDDYHAPLVPDCIYHIFNKGINGETVYKSARNRAFFLRRLFEYTGEYLEIYAWVLLGNHFHILARVRNVDETFLEAVGEQETVAAKNFIEGIKNLRNLQDFVSLNPLVNRYLEDQFKRLFTSYAKAYIKEQGRYGSLFLKSFKRMRIAHPNHVQNLIHYIHFNPVNHGCVDAPQDWAFSSYQHQSLLTHKKWDRNSLLNYFDNDEEEFNKFHSQSANYKEIERFLMD